MSRSSRHRGTIKILALYCGHSVQRVNQYADTATCPSCGTPQPILRWRDTNRMRRRRT